MFLIKLHTYYIFPQKELSFIRQYLIAFFIKRDCRQHKRSCTALLQFLQHGRNHGTAKDHRLRIIHFLIMKLLIHLLEVSSEILLRLFLCK